MSNLLEQWNKHIIRGNQLSRELENIESLIEKSKGEDICFTSKPSGATYISVLSPEKMQELRETVVVAIMQARNEKTAELEKLMGVRKPATINPEFEAAIQDMEQSSTDPVGDEPKYPDMTVELVKELYHDKDMTLDEVAKVFGTNRTALYKFVTKNNLRKPSKKDKAVFRDAQVEKSRSKELKSEKESP